MNCPNCGTENNSMAKFCAGCGNTFSPQTSSSVNIFCSKCGKENSSTTKFCGGCGSPLLSQNQIVQEPYQPISSSSSGWKSQEKQERKFCRSTENKWITGICGGLGNYFHYDPIFFRILLPLSGPMGVLIYLILWIVMPKEKKLNF